MNIDPARSQEAFEACYSGGRDPWSFANDPYELGRYQSILASLQRSSYGTIYEPGCSIGVLTWSLAAIADRVIATDFAPSAIAQARARCARRPNIEFICADLQGFTPREPLDLIVFSEIGYYFSATALTAIVSKLADEMPQGSEFVAAHWLGTSDDHVLHGHRVHEIVGHCLTWCPTRVQLHPQFRLDSWLKT
jgi:SAM-dependent methyltransferase